MVESAYVKLCLGDTEDALFMFTEVRDVAVTHKDDFLSQVCSLHVFFLVLFFFVTRSVLYPLGIPTHAINQTVPRCCNQSLLVSETT